MRNRHRAGLAVRRERELRRGIEPVRIDALADRHAVDHFAVRAVHHHHQLVVAAEEQPVRRGIERHAGGRFAGCSGPRVGDLVRRRVDLLHRVEILHVHIDLAGLRVGLRRFRLALERDGRDDLACLRVDHRR